MTKVLLKTVSVILTGESKVTVLRVINSLRDSCLMLQWKSLGLALLNPYQAA